MRTRLQCLPRRRSCRRAGISLLEVLISMFILAVGIISVLGLFTAGREIQARTAIRSQAVSFADQMLTTADQWRELAQWRIYDRAQNIWVPATAADVRLPVVIDPYSLNRDSINSFLPLVDDDWDCANFVDIRPVSQVPPAAPPWNTFFRRVTLPAGANALSFEEALSLFGDADAIEYELPADAASPPRNQFEFGRRKRGNDFSAALMVDQIVSQPIMRYWLLVFHKQPVHRLPGDYDRQKGVATRLPQGVLKLLPPAGVSNITAGLAEFVLLEPEERNTVRRGLQPGRWILVINAETWNPLVFHWSKMSSVTEMPLPPGIKDRRWLVVLESPPPPAIDNHAAMGFVFDSLVHVQELTDLAGEPLK